MLNLEKFKIIELNGDQNITIDFKGNKKVLIAENGSGKTTIMNIMYYALRNDVNSLQKYDFSKCIIKFENKDEIVFEKNKLKEISSKENLRKVFDKSKISIENISVNVRLFENIGRLFLKNTGYSAFEKFLLNYFDFIVNNSDNKLRSVKKSMYLKNYIYSLFNEHGFNGELFEINRIVDGLSKLNYNDLIGLYYYLREERYIYEIDRRYSANSKNEIFAILKTILSFLLIDNIKDNEKDKEVLSFLRGKLIFLPTYRRIEHESVDLFSEEINLKEGTILSFGVSDVNLLFNKITEKLNNYAISSFNKINNRALNDFISGDHEIDSSLHYWINKDEDYFVKVLQRVGKEIDENNKLKLKEIFKLKHSNDKFLLKLIRKMCEIYDNQSRIESEIIKYIKVCNKYLFNKEFSYDKESLKFKILQKKKDGTFKDIKLSSLSSGEKQILSIFAKLYLVHLPNIDLDKDSTNETSEGYWILFDEPELSLSVEWQEMLLPDIIDSNRCNFLFATTHSPFIFNNESKYYTAHINECVEDLDSE